MNNSLKDTALAPGVHIIYTDGKGSAPAKIRTPYGEYPTGCFLLGESDGGQVIWFDAILQTTEDFGEPCDPVLAAKIIDHLNDAAGVTPAIREAFGVLLETGKWGHPLVNHKQHSDALPLSAQMPGVSLTHGM